MICTFFGHADAPEHIRAALFDAIVRLVEGGVTTFYVGNHGNFDRMAATELHRAQAQFPHVVCICVLAYFPTQKASVLETVFPEEVATAPKRFAICYRNRYMIQRSDFVIAYVKRKTGGAAKCVAEAKRRGCCIVNLSK